MQDSTVFQIDWLKGDPDDVELFRFSISPSPSLTAHCYLQTYSIENCVHLFSGFLSDEHKMATRFTFNSFETSDAGGAVELQLSRHGTMANLRVTLIDASSKYAGKPPHVVLGTVPFGSIARFVASLKMINSGTATPAALHFTLVDQLPF